MFERTTAIDKLLKMKARKRVVQGGTWAGKTYGIIPLLIDKATKLTGKKITVIAESIPALKQGAMGNFKEIMFETGRWIDSHWNATDRRYTYSTGSYIEFHSFDSEGKAKAAGKRTDLFINEGNHIDFKIAYELIVRTTEEIWIDYNPVNEFWAHSEIIPQADAEFLLLKYTDNEALPLSIHQELMANIEKAKTSEYWRNWCRVYIDGEIGSLQGACIPNWTIIKDIPAEAKLFRRGLDFGFSNDPMAGVSVYHWNGGRIFDEYLYRTHMGISELVQVLKPLNDCDIICDNSNPLMIQELQKAGIRAKPCVKGKDSIEYGLEVINQLPVYVTERSVNWIKEARNYVIDPTTNKPIDLYNHLMDASRYAAVSDPKPAITTIGRTHRR